MMTNPYVYLLFHEADSSSDKWYCVAAGQRDAGVSSCGVHQHIQQSAERYIVPQVGEQLCFSPVRA
jgi:hypothetical protein